MHHVKRYSTSISLAGFTLMELLVWFGISMACINLALPGLQRLLHRSQATAQITWLVTAVHYTRHAAIQHRATVTLCPSKVAGKGCNGQWHEGLLVFIDRNRDGRFNQKDQVLSRQPALNTAGTIRWRSFRNRPYLQMTEAGHTNYQNGNFIYCSNTGDPRLARRIVINVQGRARLYHSKHRSSASQPGRQKAAGC